jgi:hypothetical protein
MRLLKAVLRDAAAREGISGCLEGAKPVSLWSEIVGPEVAKATFVEGFRSGVLYVRTRSNAWSCELSFYKEQFIAELNERLGNALVKDIRFRVGSIPGEERPKELGAEQEEPLLEGLPGEDVEKLEAIAGCIRNKSLRERVRALLARELARRRREAGGGGA